MQSIIQRVEEKYKKDNVTDVKSGDIVRVSQKIKEGDKVRTQVFEGLVIAAKRKKSLNSSITVRRIASGVGVEKTFLLHSPNIEKVDVVKRSKVRRNKLNYMRKRSGKSARLASIEFDREGVNKVQDQKNEVPVVPGAKEASVEELQAKAQEQETDKDTVKQDQEKESKKNDSKSESKQDKSDKDKTPTDK